MLPRLPIPGEDDGFWGERLNEFLRVSHAEDGILRQEAHSSIVDTIDELKGLDPAATPNDQLVVVRGFDQPCDGCGGLFYWCEEQPPATLDGVVMVAPVSGCWKRYGDGPIHTRWAGIKATANPDGFDPDGRGAVNRARWNDLSAFCGRSTLELLADNKVDVVVNTIFVDPGVHDFTGGTIFIAEGVGLDGAGPGRSVLRFEATTGKCIQVGTPGPRGGDPNTESAFDIVQNVSVIHADPASTGSDVGIAFDNTVRRCELRNVHVQGFGINALLNAFGMDVRHCFFEGGYTSNLRVGPQANSMLIVGCRIDGQRRASTGENVQIDSPNARSITFLRCDIQRATRVGLRTLGVASLAIRDCFFEGNNQSDGSHPDIWIGGQEVRNVVIDGCYFTGTGRFGGTSSRAINIRGDVTANARFQITNHQQANSEDDGSFQTFIDVDANVGMHVVEFNNIHAAPNSIPGSVQVKGF